MLQTALPPAIERDRRLMGEGVWQPPSLSPTLHLVSPPARGRDRGTTEEGVWQLLSLPPPLRMRTDARKHFRGARPALKCCVNWLTWFWKCSLAGGNVREREYSWDKVVILRWNQFVFWAKRDCGSSYWLVAFRDLWNVWFRAGGMWTPYLDIVWAGSLGRQPVFHVKYDHTAVHSCIHRILRKFSKFGK